MGFTANQIAASGDIVKISQDTITSATSKSYTSLSTTAYRFYLVNIELQPDSGTCDITLRLNNISSSTYNTRYITATTLLITDGGNATSFAVSTGAQGYIGQIRIPVNRQFSNTYLQVLAQGYDLNKGAVMIAGTSQPAAAVSRIDIIMSAAASGTITLYGMK